MELGHQLHRGGLSMAQSTRKVQWPFKTFSAVEIVAKIFTPKFELLVNTNGWVGTCFTVLSALTKEFRWVFSISLKIEFNMFHSEFASIYTYL